MSWLNLAAEDGHAVIHMPPEELAPHPFLMGEFGVAAEQLRTWRTVWDLRAHGGTIYDDIVAAYDEAYPAHVTSEAPIILVAPGDEHVVQALFGDGVHREHPPTIVAANVKPLPTRSARDRILF